MHTQTASHASVPPSPVNNDSRPRDRSTTSRAQRSVQRIPLGTFPPGDVRTTGRLLAAGAAGALLFVVVLFIEGATRPGYNAWLRFGSELSLSDQGWMQVANFIVSGLLIVLGAIGLARALRTGPGSTLGPILVSVFGFSLVSAGIFTMDPRPGYPVGAVQSLTPTLHSILHGLSGMVCFGSVAAAAFVLARRFRDTSGLWMPYSTLTGIVVAASFVTATASSVLSETGVFPDAPTGLLQRIGIVAGWGWLAILTLRLRSARQRQGDSSQIPRDAAIRL